MGKTGLITQEYVNTVIKERPKEIHKGQCGRVLVIAGSLGMAGAAILAARGALKSGAGLVRLAVPEELFPVLQIAVPQATCMSISRVRSLPDLDLYGAVAVGPGLGVDEENYLLLKEILQKYSGPMVLDADGLNTVCRFGKTTDIQKERKNPVILTPHPGEADRLLAWLGEEPIRTLGRRKAAQLLSARTGTIVLLKGAETLVARRGQDTYSNTTGNPGMATGGSGDVLTGVIAAFAASGMDPFDAARAGAFVHGMAGDIAADRVGQWGMTAVELEEALPAALKTIVGK